MSVTRGCRNEKGWLRQKVLQSVWSSSYSIEYRCRIQCRKFDNWSVTSTEQGGWGKQARKETDKPALCDELGVECNGDTA